MPFVNRLDAETDRVRRAARRAGSTEARDAHAADAFVAMTSEAPGRARAARAEVVYVCDLDAAARGPPMATSCVTWSARDRYR